MSKKDLFNISSIYTKQVINEKMSLDNVTELMMHSREDDSVDMQSLIDAFHKDGITDKEHMTHILVTRFNLDANGLWDEENQIVNLRY
jgi:hypothetical protein